MKWKSSKTKERVSYSGFGERGSTCVVPLPAGQATGGVDGDAQGLVIAGGELHADAVGQPQFDAGGL